MSHSSPIDSAAENAPEDAFEDGPESAAENGAKKAPDKTSRRAAGTPRRSRLSRWIPLAALVIAVIAAGLGGTACYLLARQHAAATFTDQQRAEAKKHVCAAYVAVQHAVVLNTHLTNPNPNDPTSQLAIAANARLALLGGGAYLRDRLAAEPATPADLAKALTSAANVIEQLGINYSAGASNAVQDPLRQDLDAKVSQIKGLCT